MLKMCTTFWFCHTYLLPYPLLLFTIDIKLSLTVVVPGGLGLSGVKHQKYWCSANTTSSCLTAYWCSCKHGGLFMCKGLTESFVIGRKLNSDCRDIAADVEKSALKLQGELACLPFCMLLARGLLVQAICHSR